MTHRPFIAGAAALLLLVAYANAQSTAQLSGNPGSALTVSAHVVAVSGSTTLDDTDADTASVTGAAALSLFPDAPGANYAELHHLALDVDTLSLSFCFVQFISCLSGANITIDNLHVETTAPGEGPRVGGTVTFDGVVTRMTGTATVNGTGLLAGQIDQVIPIDVTSAGLLSAHVSVAGGTVTLNGLVIPPASASVPPEDLPAGFDSVTVDLTLDAHAIALSGPYADSLLGDTDADGDIDLADHAAFTECITGPLGIATPPCTLVDFDADGNVDLMDFAMLAPLLAPTR